MKILALEFSSPQRSVAVVSAEGVTSEVIETTAGNTMKPLGMIESALREACLEREQIEIIAVGLGPGSYHGIRAAIALAQGWQLARGVKLLGVCSAECIAAQARADGISGKVRVVIDAQREELYLADYLLDSNALQEVSPLRLARLAEVHELARTGETLIGPEVSRWFPGGRVFFPRAAMLGQLALGRTVYVAGEKLEPIYLRETRFVKVPGTRVFPTG